MEDERPPDSDWLIDTSSHGPEVMVEQAERSQLLWQLIDGLPQEKREVLHLIYQKEMALREVAIELGIPEGTVKSRLPLLHKTSRPRMEGNRKRLGRRKGVSKWGRFTLYNLHKCNVQYEGNRRIACHTIVLHFGTRNPLTN